MKWSNSWRNKDIYLGRKSFGIVEYGGGRR